MAAAVVNVAACACQSLTRRRRRREGERQGSLGFPNPCKPVSSSSSASSLQFPSLYVSAAIQCTTFRRSVVVACLPSSPKSSSAPSNKLYVSGLILFSFSAIYPFFFLFKWVLESDVVL